MSDSAAGCDDPRAELAALASALRTEARRRRGRGHRLAAPPPAGEELPRPAAAAAPPRTSASPAPHDPGDAVSHEPAAKSEPPAGAASVGRAAQREQLEETAARIRARAAACADLESLRAAVAGCTACSLCETRTQTVFVDGDGSSGVMFVGEAPGYHEDVEGVPFVGRAGKLLTDIITKGMGLRREHVAICNVLKCRPPENRDPTPAEKTTCTPWLDRQIELFDPRVIIPLGRHAACHVLQVDAPMGRLRGRVHELGGRRVVPTYHPAYLLRSPGQKKECWKDIQLAMEVLGLDRR